MKWKKEEREKKEDKNMRDDEIGGILAQEKFFFVSLLFLKLYSRKHCITIINLFV